MQDGRFSGAVSMKKLWAILFLCLPAFGQAVYSGPGAYSGYATYNAGSVGVPLTYAARTDNCVTGAETGCVAGRTTGQAGSALSFLGQTGDPMPFGNLDPANTAYADPDFNSYMVMATQAGSCGFSTVVAWTVSDGGYNAFSPDSSLLVIPTSGNAWCMFYIDTARFHAKTCSPSNPCITYTGIKTGASDSGSGCAWSGKPTGTETGCTVMQTLAVFGFSSSPSTCTGLLELTSDNITVNCLTFNPPADKHTTGWTFTRTPYADPVSGGVVPATFSSDSPWSGATITSKKDGSIGYVTGGAGDWVSGGTYGTATQNDEFVYPRLNNVGGYAYQATFCGALCSAGTSEPNPWNQTVGGTSSDSVLTWTNIGKLGGQGPGFDVLNYIPGVGWSRLNTRLGVVFRGLGNSDPAGTLVTDNPAACYNLYGSATTPCALTDENTIHDGSGFNWTPTGGGGAPASGFSGSDKNQAGTQQALPHNYYWSSRTTTVRPCILWTNGVSGNCDAHAIGGSNGLWKGGSFYYHLYAAPNCTSAGVPSATCTALGSANPGTKLFNTGFNWDQHGANNAANSTDTNPPRMFMTDVPAQGRLANSGYPGHVAGYQELDAIATDGTQKLYRIMHNYNTGSSKFFSVQNNEGTNSSDGTFAAIQTDVMGTRGSVSPDWASGHGYNPGDLINPCSNNANQSSFQIQGSACTSSSGPITWPQTSGQVVTDNNCTWTNVSGVY
jgi:hypothetical protein